MKRFDNFLGSDINYGLIMWESHDKELLNQIAYDSHKIIPSEYLYIQDELCDLLKDEPSSGLVLIYNYLKKYKKSNIYLVGFNFENNGESEHSKKYKAHSFNKESKIVKLLQKITKRLYFLN